MPLLESFLATMTEYELRELEQHISKVGKQSNRVDTRALQLLIEEPDLSGQAAALKLYGKANLNAYHTVRKRLTRRTQEYITLKSLETGINRGDEIRMVVRAARFLLTRGQSDAAAKMLRKARNAAKQKDLYVELVNVLSAEVEYSDELGLDSELLVNEWKEAQELASLQERVDLAYNVLRIKLRETRLTGFSGDLQKLVRGELDQLGIDLHQKLPASIVYKMMTIIRMAIVASKQYHQFDPLVTQAYEQLERDGLIQKADLKVRIGFLYIIAHTKYRTRSLEEANEWLGKLGEYMTDTRRRAVLDYLGRYFLLKAAIPMYQGEVKKSIRSLNNALERKDLRVSDTLNIRLNLSVYEFIANNPKRTLSVLVNNPLSDKECERHMGPEWCFKKDLIQTIALAELGIDDVAEIRLKRIRNHYSNILSADQHQRIAGFLKVVQWVMNSPEKLRTPEFEEKVEHAIQRLPGNMEDLQAMTFYCWVKSKMVGRSYYSVLVETVATFGKDRITDY
ncbi:MAG: hypothetical protein MK081_03580 [Flavobacteriales bacterium]|nr:hypothetical protein [Flavobacteriales bacterium]